MQQGRDLRDPVSSLRSGLGEQHKMVGRAELGRELAVGNAAGDRLRRGGCSGSRRQRRRLRPARARAELEREEALPVGHVDLLDCAVVAQREQALQRARESEGGRRQRARSKGRKR